MNERINLQNLSALLAEKASITKMEAETFLREYFEVIREELIKNESLKIKDLGTFKLSQVDDRESIDVTTGERIWIPTHHKVVFLPDKKLAETVNEPFAFFETTEIDEDSVLEGLKLLPEEDASEESEPTLDEEEEIGPDECEKEGEKPVSQEIPSSEKEMEVPTSREESLLYRKLESYCLTCQYYKAYHNYQEEYSQNRKKLNLLRVNIGILSALLVIALGYIIYLTYFEGPAHFRNSPPVPFVLNKDTVRDTVPNVLGKLTDSIIPIEQDESEKNSLSDTSKKSKQVTATPIQVTAAPKQATATPKQVTAAPKQAIVAPKQVTTTPKQVAVTPAQATTASKQVTIAPGQRLTTIAQNEYGNKVFWIYIYMENKAVIRNPNVVPAGTKISIPPAEKYGIDSNDSASVQKAKGLVFKHP